VSRARDEMRERRKCLSAQDFEESVLSRVPLPVPDDDDDELLDDDELDEARMSCC
jgi:hypothetical protein